MDSEPLDAGGGVLGRARRAVAGKRPRNAPDIVRYNIPANQSEIKDPASTRREPTAVQLWQEACFRHVYSPGRF
jgi:hypothetical protein